MTEPSRARPAHRLGVLLPYALLCFAANSLITRYVVTHRLLDAGLLSALRFLAGAAALVALAVVRRQPIAVSRANLLPGIALGTYAICISYGYQHIGAAAGTFVFYATVLLTLVLHDTVSGLGVPPRRRVGALLALLGILVLTHAGVGDVTLPGVALLTATGIAWGLYTVAGRGDADPTSTTTGNFVILLVIAAPTAGVSAAFGSTLTAAGLIWAVLMGSVTTAFAYIAWYRCQSALAGTTAGAAQLAVPLLTTFGAVVLLHEKASDTLLLATALVGTGIWLCRASAADPVDVAGAPAAIDAARIAELGHRD